MFFWMCCSVVHKYLRGISQLSTKMFVDIYLGYLIVSQFPAANLHLCRTGLVVRFSSCVPSYKQFLPKNRGLRRSWEGAELLIPQLAALALVIDNFLLPPVLFIEQTRYPLYLETARTVHSSIEYKRTKPLLNIEGVQTPWQKQQLLQQRTIPTVSANFAMESELLRGSDLLSVPCTIVDRKEGTSVQTKYRRFGVYSMNSEWVEIVYTVTRVNAAS